MTRGDAFVIVARRDIQMIPHRVERFYRDMVARQGLVHADHPPDSACLTFRPGRS